MEVCPVCCKPLKLAVSHRKQYIAYGDDDNGVWRYVGATCYKNIKKAGKAGWKQPDDYGDRRWYINEIDALNRIKDNDTYRNH